MSERFEPTGIIQIKPPHRWAGCLAVVKEVREWGVIAYMQLPGPCEGVVMVVPENRAFMRLTWDDVVATGGRVEET